MQLRTIGFLEIGGVPERLKGADCKSAGTAFEGSNPSPSTMITELFSAGVVQW